MMPTSIQTDKVMNYVDQLSGYDVDEVASDNGLYVEGLPGIFHKNEQQCNAMNVLVEHRIGIERGERYASQAAANDC